MNIGIDARLMYETGVGRYIRNLLLGIAEVGSTHTFILYVQPGTDMPFSLPTHWKIHEVRSRWHSVNEQIELPYECMKDHLDLLHVPYFTVPLFYPGKIVTTIHDITILRVSTGMASTLPPYQYQLKRFGYRFVLQTGLHKAKHIFSVSQTTKKDICQTFSIPKEKITVTYEGVDPDIVSHAVHKKSPVDFPYILYVGNAYPHKNLELLFIALQIYKTKDGEALAKRRLKLICIGKHDYFYQRLKQKVHDLQLENYVVFTGEIDDNSLSRYYSHAQALVSPSLAEGFALPPLEALSCDTPVIVSDIPVFRELLPSHAAFIHPYNAQEWYSVLKSLPLKKPVWKDDKEKKDFFSRYSWKEMARQTLHGYESV